MLYRRTFLKSSVGLAAAAMLAPALSAAKPAPALSLRAGAGRADAALTALYPLGEFVGEHDPLAARVVLLENGDQRLAIAVIDLTSITQEVILRMKAILTELAGVPAQQAIVVASHTFSTPHIFAGQSPGGASANGGNSADDKTLAAFEAALRAATQQAVATLQAARLGASNGYSRIGVNRNVSTPFGWWLGADDAGFSDPHVGVVRVERLDGKPLAILMNYAVQPAVMDASERAAGGRLVSADLAGAAARRVEAHYGDDTVAMYLVGSGGDQVPYLQASRPVVYADGSAGRIDMHEAGFALLDLFGQRLGDEVIRVSDSISSDPMTALKWQRTGVTVTSQAFSPRNAPKGPVKSFDYKAGPRITMPVMLMQLGDIAIVGVQPELSASIGARIRAASPYANTLIVTMVDGAAKYLPDASNYDRFTYEARSSPFARGGAEVAANAIITQLKQMKDLASGSPNATSNRPL